MKLFIGTMFEMINDFFKQYSKFYSNLNEQQMKTFAFSDKFSMIKKNSFNK